MNKNEKKLAELHSLRAWCMTVIEYVIKIDKSSSPLLTQFKVVVDSSFDKKNLKGLDTIKKDLSELLGDLSVSQRRELSGLLTLNSNDPLLDFSKKAERIFLKGCVDNEDDYRFLNRYIDYLLEHDTTEDIDKINKILLQYLETLEKGINRDRSI